MIVLKMYSLANVRVQCLEDVCVCVRVRDEESCVLKMWAGISPDYAHLYSFNQAEMAQTAAMIDR